VLKSPQLATFLKWIKQAWDKVSPDIVRRSFKKCGLSNAMDGSEDHMLFCDEGDSSEDEFMGFTSEEIEDTHEVAANMASTNAEAIELDVSSTDASDSDEDSSECDDPMSPGH
jgi:hypothetical protein